MKNFFTTLILFAAIITALFIPYKTLVFSETVVPGTINDGLSVNGRAAYLVDYDSGTVMYSLNENDRYPIASMVKIMTLLLSFEAAERGDVNFDEEITVSSAAASMGGSQVFLDVGEVKKFGELIKSICVASANDSSVAVAERLGGSEIGFVKLMNKRAKELGMDNTLFCNATGLPAPSQYSTARDVSVMTRELVKFDLYREFCGVWLEDFVHSDGRVTTMTNTNKLVRFYKGCDSGKTGFTSEAMYCLSASAKRGDMRVIGTILGSSASKQRNYDMSCMFDYAFGNFENKVIYSADDFIENSIEVKKGVKTSINISPEKSISVFSERGTDADYNIQFELIKTITAPVNKGDEVGKAIITVNGKSFEVKIVAAENVEKAKLFDEIQRIIRSW